MTVNQCEGFAVRGQAKEDAELIEWVLALFGTNALWAGHEAGETCIDLSTEKTNELVLRGSSTLVHLYNTRTYKVIRIPCMIQFAFN